MKIVHENLYRASDGTVSTDPGAGPKILSCGATLSDEEYAAIVGAEVPADSAPVTAEPVVKSGIVHHRRKAAVAEAPTGEPKPAKKTPKEDKG